MFREREEDDWQRQQIVDRWQNAGRSILSSVRMVRNAETLGDKFASGADRCSKPFIAAVHAIPYKMPGSVHLDFPLSCIIHEL